MTIAQRVATTRSMRRQRAILVTVAVVASAIDGVTKLAAEANLDDGPAHIVGPLSFELGHNSGVAFGLGATGPVWVVLAVTALVIAGLALAALRGTLGSPVAAGLILGGAVANFVDRTGGGSVTDMIDVGWWRSVECLAPEGFANS